MQNKQKKGNTKYQTKINPGNRGKHSKEKRKKCIRKVNEGYTLLVNQ